MKERFYVVELADRKWEVIDRSNGLIVGVFRSINGQSGEADAKDYRDLKNSTIENIFFETVTEAQCILQH